MERVIINGDYVPDGGGGLKTVSGGEEVLARVLFRLTARRGALPFLPQLGSRLHELAREKPSARQSLAQQYVGEALREETDVSVESVTLEQQGEIGVLTVKVRWQGETLTGRWCWEPSGTRRSSRLTPFRTGRSTTSPSRPRAAVSCSFTTSPKSRR